MSKKMAKWYYVNDKGDKLIGQQTVDGVEVYFDKDGVQAKGIFANADHFYDKDTGAAVRDQIVEVDGKRYYVGPDGRKVYSGTHIVHGEEVNLIVGDGHQAFGEFTGTTEIVETISDLMVKRSQKLVSSEPKIITGII